MPLPIVALKPGAFAPEEAQEIFSAVQHATLAACNIDGGLKLDNVVVMTETVASKHDWAVHVRITLKRRFFGHLADEQLAELRDRFKRNLHGILERKMEIKRDEIKPMIELIDRY